MLGLPAGICQGWGDCGEVGPGLSPREGLGESQVLCPPLGWGGEERHLWYFHPGDNESVADTIASTGWCAAANQWTQKSLPAMEEALPGVS